MSDSSRETVDGRYLIQSQLGAGGMGVVFRVWDQALNVGVALKRMSPAAAAQESAVRLFEREFHALKNLDHPNIVRVQDYGIDGVPYYTMELLSGEALTELAPMPWREACSILRDAASALALVHSRRLVHRDVTPRNLQRTSEGVVKLIDFGGLANMGVANECVGTPAFMAPETLHRLSLDQRTDLYSLGATAYLLLTGRRAFPVRKLSELAETWRQRPPPPSSIVPGIPPELDSLLGRMIDVDPMARPVSASIVMAHLTSIADLPEQPSVEVARSFLTTPKLVGREQEVQRFRELLTRAKEGSGGCLLVESAPGTGRSRILDTFALEGQLAGALLLRADARDGARESDTTAALAKGLKGTTGDLTDGSSPDTPFLKDLRHRLRSHPVVALVDDAHQYCPESLAQLVGLAPLTDDHPFVLVVSHSLPLPDDALDAIRLLRRKASRMELAALDIEQTTEVLASCFNDAPNIAATAKFCHTVSAGRPATCMELAQHLVDVGIACYRGGGWTLPESLAGHSLPENAENLLAQRLRGLDGNQRLWGQFLSMIPAFGSLSTAECVQLLSPHLSNDESHAALEALTAEQLVFSEGAITRITNANVRKAFLAAAPQERVRSLHRALAKFFAARDDPNSSVAAAYHWQEAGDKIEGMEAITRFTDQINEEVGEEVLAQRVVPFGQWGATIEAALDAGEQGGLPPSRLYPFYSAIMSAAALVDPHWLPRGKPMFAHLKRDTGLMYWSEAELDKLEAGAKASIFKLIWRLLRATARHLLTPRSRRGLWPIAALNHLGLYTTQELGVCNLTQTFHVGVPPLARALLPFRALSPAIPVVYALVAGAANAGRGLAAGWQGLTAVRARLALPLAGMSGIAQQAALQILTYLDAVECLAPLGDPRALTVAKTIEDGGGFDAHAAQLRMLYYLYIGDAAQAQRCKEQLDVLALASTRDNLSLLSGSKDVAQAQALSGDAPGLRATLESLEVTAKRFPAWRGQLLVYRGEYARLMGNLAQACEALEEALAFARPGENYSWPKAAAPYVDVLVQLGRVPEAVAFADQASAECERLDLAPIYRRQIETSAALAWAAQGDHGRAAQRLDELLATARAMKVHGVTLATLAEARARVALLQADAEGFEQQRQTVADVFSKHDSPALVARYRKLANEATDLGLARHETLRPMSSDNREYLPRTLAEVSQNIADDSAPVRLRRGLELLMKHCDAVSGLLYLVGQGRPQRVALSGDIAPTTDLTDFVHQVCAAEAALDSEDATELVQDVTGESEVATYTKGGVHFEPLLLRDSGDFDGPPLAIAFLRPREAALQQPPIELTRVLAAVLAETGDLGTSV